MPLDSVEIVARMAALPTAVLSDALRRMGLDPCTMHSSMKPVWDGKDFQPRLMLPLCLSYDHRVIDGAMAARFTRRICEILGDMRQLVL